MRGEASFGFRRGAIRGRANGAHVAGPGSSDRVARGVQVVAWLMSRQAGETFLGLRQRFGWPADELRAVLEHLARRGQVTRNGRRYLVTTENTWREPR